MSKPRRPSSSSSLNPWDALFASVTRPRTVPALPVVAIATNNNNDDDNTTTTKTTLSSSLASADAGAGSGGYTILIQHSMTCSSQRQWAVASCVGATASVAPGAGRAAVVSPWKDSLSRPMVVRQAFEELCYRCNGAVVFVSLLGDGGGVLDMEELGESDGYGITDDEDGGDQHDNDDNDDEMCQRMNNLHLARKQYRRTPVLRKFRKYGAYVDLSLNPFGWDDEDATDNNSIIHNEEDDSFVHRSMIPQLPSIVRTIQKAVASIEHRRRHCQPNATTTTTTGKQQQTQQQQPIPIVFDSLTPLLQYHGVEKIILMLKCLRRVAVSTPPTIPTEGGTSSSSSSYSSIISPIVAPVVFELLRPSEHRSLEDVADALIHLKFMDTSGDHVSTSTTSPSTAAGVIRGMLDLVRRGGGGGGGGSGGKFMRHCVPVRILRSSMDSAKLNNRLKENWSWEILDHDGSHHGTDVAVAKEESLQTKPPTNVEPDSLTNNSTTRSSSRPRIYLQDDDPDDEFYDEEADYDYG